VVATDSAEIADAVRQPAGARDDAQRSRLRLGPHFRGAREGRPQARAKIVVNVQGDFPMLSPPTSRPALAPLADPDVDIGRQLVLEITDGGPSARILTP
jgi:3-deoxy-manno-octulosonate cytidylyltransferase (CMP-KDO synthetase)